MSARRTIFIGLLVALVLGAVAWLWVQNKSSIDESEPQTQEVAQSYPARPSPRVMVLDETKFSRPKGVLAGNVEDPSGRPVVGAFVCAHAERVERPDHTEVGPRCSTSTASGSFRIEAIPPGEFVLNASAPKFRPGRYWPDPRVDSVSLTSGEVREDLSIVLLPGGANVHGIVRDVSGGTIEGAWVSVSEQGPIRSHIGSHATATARTDAQGRFEAWVALGRVSATVVALGYADGWQEGSAPGVPLELYLTPASSVSGTVVRIETAERVAGIRVELTVSHHVLGVRVHETTFTDQDGAFAFNRLPPGTYKARAVAQGLYGEGPTVHVGLIEASKPVEIEVSSCLSLTALVVVRETAAPCRGANVQLRSDDGYTAGATVNSDGRAVFSPIAPGRYVLAPQCTSHLEDSTYEPVVVTDRSVETTLEVSQGATIRGTVVDQDGNPSPMIEISAQATDEAARGPTNLARSAFSQPTGIDGVFVLTGMAAGTHELEVFAAERAVPDPIGVRVEKGQTLEGVKFELPAGGQVNGVVHSPNGKPLPGLQLLVDPDRGSATRVYTDAGGAFSVSHISTGSGSIEVTEPRFGVELAQADSDSGVRYSVGPSESTRVDVVVEPLDASITGEVVGADGAPASDAFVDVARETGKPGSNPNAATRELTRGFGRSPTLTDLSGEFAVSGLAQGSYTVRAFRRGGGVAVAQGVQTGGRVRLQIEQNARVTGRLTGPGDAPRPERFDIVLHELQTGQERVDTFYRTDGRWVMDEVPPGQYRVSARSQIGAAARQLLVEPGAVADVLLNVRPNVTVRGRVVDVESGEPVVGRRIVVIPRGGSVSFGDAAGEERKDVTDAQGRFEFDGAPQGEVSIAVTKAQLGTDDGYGFMVFVPSTLDAGETETIEIEDVFLAKRPPRQSPRGTVGYRTKDIEEHMFLLGADGVEEARAQETSLEERRVEIAEVVDGGAAQTAGLLAGDIIVSVGSIDVTGARSYLHDGLTDVLPGEVITLELTDGRKLELTAQER